VSNHEPFSVHFRSNYGANYPEWPVLPHLGLLLCVQTLFPLQRGLTPPQCPVLFCPQPSIRSSNLLRDFPSSCFPETFDNISRAFQS
jgi:hypothetical protein